jgi:beta-D-xylosidase 4
MTDMSMRPNVSTGYPGRSYRFYTNDPVFAFGHGLSYTSFRYSFKSAPSFVVVPFLGQQDNDQKQGLVIDDSMQGGEGDLGVCSSFSFRVEVVVKNEGERSGSNVVMLYSQPPGSGRNGVPQKSLISYQRVEVEPHMAREVGFDVHPCKDLSTVKADGERSLDLGEYVLSLGHGVQHRVELVNASIEQVFGMIVTHSKVR